MAMQRRIIVLVGLAAVAGAAVLTVELRGLGSVTPVPAKLTVLDVNKTRTFAPGVLRPGDLVTCRVHHSYQGPPLAMSIPIHPSFGSMSGTGPGVMAVRVRANGAVIASCIARNRLPLDKRGRTS